MARHAKGKHIAKKASLKHKAKKAAYDEKVQGDPEDQASASSGDGAEEPSPLSPSDQAASSVPNESASPSGAPDEGAPKPKHAKPSSSDCTPDAAHPCEEASSSEQRTTRPILPPKKKRKGVVGKRFGIAAAVVAGVIAVGYLAGVAVFHTHFYPNTNISMVDISLDSPERAAAELDETVGSFSFKVKGQGMNLTVTSSQVGMELDSAAVTGAVLEEQFPWEWPFEIFEEHDVTDAVADAMSASGLSEVIEQAVAEVNQTAEAPIDASVIFKDDVGKFYISPEVEGTMLDPVKVVDRCMDGLLNLKKDVVLKKDARLDPNIFEDDQRLVDACAKANQLARADITFTLDGNPAANVNATTIGAWVTVTPEFEVLFNHDELAIWGEWIAEQFDTVGSERVYTRPDGKEVTVSGGSYGWKVDSEALEVAAVEAVQNGTIGNVEIPVLQSGRGFTALGSQDWGARYVDVDISEQYARFYDDSGALIWESDIVSGAKGQHDSPTGVYTLNHKQSPTVLIGEMTSDGTPEYESRVTYWMPFKGNSVGLHDASWQSAFGGQRYASGFGSHGCINLPTGAAGELYGLIEPGDVVVVHY